MIVSWVPKIKLKLTTREEDRIIVTRFTFHRVTFDYNDILCVKIQTSSYCFHKMQRIYNIYMLIIVSVEEFKRFCRTVWEECPHQFVTIDLTSKKLEGKYRKNLDCFYLPGVNSHVYI